MSLFRFLFLGVAFAISQSSFISVVQADEPVAVDAKKRAVFQEARPDWSRSWVIVSRQSYWPLCYESLDRTQEAAELIGKNKPQELSAALEKVSAWLKLSASAANTDGEEGIIDASELVDDAVESIENKDKKFSDEQLKSLLTLACTATAKSHVLRATNFDDDTRARRWARNTNGKPAATKEEAELRKEIAKELVEKGREQYSHDTEQSYRHIVVAQAYLAAAEEMGGVKISADLMNAFEPLKPGVKAYEMANYFDDEITARATKLLAEIDAQRKVLIGKIQSGS
ncbi:hypothetical protein [Rubripirellula reticaptiva]|uniref:Imelysin n=1 Tax=Rubripirellula reticaptiva TaxID=2528013 RepID=A0A5C6F1R9_9BACT|nr:hypothetical protein [Rubripirellula reticaptiva]TWU55035.1 hypothetical protein Poly59_13280 [Rubripirellula reticaptiva]